MLLKLLNLCSVVEWPQHSDTAEQKNYYYVKWPTLPDSNFAKFCNGLIYDGKTSGLQSLLGKGGWPGWAPQPRVDGHALCIGRSGLQRCERWVNAQSTDTQGLCVSPNINVTSKDSTTHMLQST